VSVIEEAVHVVALAFQENGDIERRIAVKQLGAVFRVDAYSAAFKLVPDNIGGLAEHSERDSFGERKLEQQRIVGVLMDYGEDCTVCNGGIKLYILKKFVKFSGQFYRSFQRVLHFIILFFVSCVKQNAAWFCSLQNSYICKPSKQLYLLFIDF
jgi:hypothetical protein